MTIRDDVLITASLIADDPSDERAIVERLVAQGYDAFRAELLIAFVPLGLARPVIARLEANPPIDLPDTVMIRDFIGNRTLEVNLADVPEFMTACQLGEETFLTDDHLREQLRAASSISVELNLISKVLNEGHDIGGGKMAPPILLRLAETPGFEEWYQSIKPTMWKRFVWWLHRLIAKFK